MLYNYLKVIIRNFFNDKMYTSIIVFGLAIGIAVCLIIGQYVYYELSFDKHIESRKSIYYAYLNWKSPDKEVDGKCFPAIAYFAQTSIPEVESSVRIADMAWNGNTLMLRREENGKTIFYSQADRLLLADAGVLKFFNVPLLSGDAEKALREPQTMVITRSVAQKFFHKEDPINKTLIVQLGGYRRIECRITGVTEDPSPNASLQYDALYSMESVKLDWDIDKAWTVGDFQTFLKLHPGSDFKSVEHKLNELATPLRPLEVQLKTKLSIHLYPFEDFHFFRHNNSYTTKGIQFTGDKKLITYFGILASLVLIISWANYINLTTARALRRAKEVGLRKVNGASRRNLIFQFLIEFFFLNLISIILAFTIAQLLFPTFTKIIGSNATWIFWTEPWFWLIVFLILIFSTVASGIYPAFILSDYNPSKVLKGNFSRSQSGIAIRKVLVVVQFSLSVIMIMSIYVISRQLFFMQDKDLGISVDQVVVIRTNELDVALDRKTAFQQLKLKINNFDKVTSVSSAAIFPGGNTPRQTIFHLEADAEKKSRPLLNNPVGENYFKTMGLELLYGRDFRAGPSKDSTSVVINEKATQELGFAEPQAAIGEQLIFADTGMKYEIVGIIKDFNLNLKEPDEGEVFYQPNRASMEFFLVKLSTNDLKHTLASIETEWKHLFSGAPFDYFFLDTYFETFYREEQRFAGVFAFFSVIGILITCMGLFGLSLYDTGSRTKEIGIRKTLGASISSIMWLFSKEYMKLVLIAAALGIPAGVWLLNEWLNNYPHRISLDADAVVLPMVLMCCIAIFTVGYHTFKTACVDPVKSLKSE